MSNPFTEALSKQTEGAVIDTPKPETLVTYDEKFVTPKNHEHVDVTDEPIIAIFLIPHGRSYRRLENPEGEAYTQVGFATGTGQYINCFIYFEEAAVRSGKTLVTAATVRKKVTEDGREFLYAELRPTEKSATHTLHIWGKKKFAQECGKLCTQTLTIAAFGNTPGGIVFLPK